MIALTTDGFALVFRSEVADPLEGVDATQPDSECLWKNAEIYQYMTEAADAVSRRVEGGYRKIQVPIVAATETTPPTPVPLPLPRGVLHIREARLTTRGTYIEPSQANQHHHASYDAYQPLYRFTASYTYGIPREYVRDYERHALLLFPIPNISDTLELQCSMTIAVPMSAGFPMPFMDVPDQRLMLHYMKYLAYSKQDADTVDLARATQFYKLFDAEATERESKLRSYRRRPGQVRCDW